MIYVTNATDFYIATNAILKKSLIQVLYDLQILNLYKTIIYYSVNFIHTSERNIRKHNRQCTGNNVNITPNPMYHYPLIM